PEGESPTGTFGLGAGDDLRHTQDDFGGDLELGHISGLRREWSPLPLYPGPPPLGTGRQRFVSDVESGQLGFEMGSQREGGAGKYAARIGDEVNLTRAVEAGELQGVQFAPFELVNDRPAGKDGHAGAPPDGFLDRFVAAQLERNLQLG